MTPLDVLREALGQLGGWEHSHSATSPEALRDRSAALAEVEALVTAARHVVFPFDFDPTEIHSAWHGSELAAALAPFQAHTGDNT